MNRALFPEKEKGVFYVRFNMDGLMRGDYKSRMEGYAIGRQNGWMSANDIRALENLNPIPDEQGGNAYLVNGNMIPIWAAAEGRSASRVASDSASRDTDSSKESASESNLSETPDETKANSKGDEETDAVQE